MKKFSFLLLVACISQVMIAQTPEQRAQITKDYDKQAINQLYTELLQKEQQAQQRVEQYLVEHNVKQIETTEDGNVRMITDVVEGIPVYTITENFTGARAMGAEKLYNGGSLGLNIEGQGMLAGVWDGGYTRQTHVDLINRVTYGEPNKSLSDHATHVGGTIISSGDNSIVRRGVAPQASIVSYRFDSDTSEMLQQALSGMLVSNHSYGLDSSSSTPISVYGKYDNFARSFDLLCFLYEYYLPVVSAGNDRNSGLNFNDNGYDLLTDRSLAKNVLTVGAVNTIVTYNGPSSVQMSNFSSWGPADDGRIKPDIVAKGVSVNSTTSNSDTSYGVRQGTSMSAPMVTCGILLLQQLYNQQNSSFMKAATVKALVLSTTLEAGSNPGPDYSFGWGHMSVENAAYAILNTNGDSDIKELNLANGGTYTSSVTSNNGPLKVAISWTDAAGTENNGPEDDSTPALVYDLDIKLTDSNGNDFFPWKLDPSIPFAAATKGINNVDNVEIVEIDVPNGTYTITVNHKNNLPTNGLDFSMVITGADTGTLSSSQVAGTEFQIYPNPATSSITILASSLNDSKKAVVDMYDMLGQRVFSKNYNVNGSLDETIDISNLNSGIYIVRVSNGSSITSQKLVIE
ncbi:S8 family serine peptidase [Nonlabens tegetincola]|uniref:S8 family serine peptidase n=1 Tax=Nonlabens tegetincola TaxID=323273 RepID=UPI0030C87DCE